MKVDYSVELFVIDALRGEILRTMCFLEPDERKAFDLIWPDGPYDEAEMRFMLSKLLSVVNARKERERLKA